MAWSRMLNEADDNTQVLYVVSAFRALTTEPEAAAAMLPDIESHSHLRANAILNTSNLGDETTAEHVEHGRAFACEVARLTGLPLAATIVPAVVGELPDGDEPMMLMPRHVRMPWD